MGATDASGVTRYTVDPALTAGKRYVWRVRAEMSDAVGPWSNVMAFTTAGASATAPATPTGPESAGPRPPDPPPGVRLPLPDMQGVLGAVRATPAESCPRGLKYVNNPWQDRVIDAIPPASIRAGVTTASRPAPPPTTTAFRSSPPATKPRITTAAVRIRVRPKCTWSTCWAATAAHADADVARVHG